MLGRKLLIDLVARNPRLSIALPDGLLRALERWAEAEGNKPTSLATFLLEQAIRQAIAEGKVPPEEPKENAATPASASLEAFLSQLVDGKPLTESQLKTIAAEMGVKADTLIALSNRLRENHLTGD